METRLDDLVSLEPLRPRCRELLDHEPKVPAEPSLVLAPARAAARLVLGEVAEAKSALKAYLEHWKRILQAPDGLRGTFAHVIELPMTDARHESFTALSDGIRISAASGEFELVGQLASAWQHEADTNVAWPLESVPPSEAAIAALCTGREREFLDFANELWDDWLQYYEVDDSPYWRAMRAGLEKDGPRFRQALAEAHDDVIGRLKGLDPRTHGLPVVYFHLITLSDLAILTHASRQHPELAAPSLLPAYAARFWGLSDT